MSSFIRHTEEIMKVRISFPGEEPFVATRLGCDAEEFKKCSLLELCTHIIHRRAVIRWHREQRGDDRCWLDDWVIHLMLADTPAEPARLPADTLDRCQQFFENRQAPNDPEVLSEFGVAERLRADFPTRRAVLMGMEGRRQLVAELGVLQLTILQHRLAEPRTWFEDRLLYNLMPEQRPAITHLPPREEFLAVQAGASRGCPQFLASHVDCAARVACDLHRWGGSCDKTSKIVQLID